MNLFGSFGMIISVLIVISLISIIALIIFGHHFLKILRLGISLEFRTAMGLFCFLGFICLLYVGIHSEYLSTALYIISPEEFQKSIIESMHYCQKLVIIAAIVLILSNFLLLGFLHKK